jgi:SAM-dependent methyltransferase
MIYFSLNFTHLWRVLHQLTSSPQRDQAWDICPYPCIGQFRFLDFSITLSPHYPSLVKRLTTQNQIFLDLGCGFGQDIRALAVDGALSQNLYGSDLYQEFWELGYALFNDKDRLHSPFIQVDLLSADGGLPGGLKELKGKVDVLYAGSLLHLFDYEEQVKVCELIIELLRPVKDSVVLGRQVGNVVAGETPRRTTDPDKKMYRHNDESFKKMWKDLGEKMGTKWRVEAEMGDGGQMGSARWDPNFRDLQFAVFRN